MIDEPIDGDFDDYSAQRQTFGTESQDTNLRMKNKMHQQQQQSYHPLPQINDPDQFQHTQSPPKENPYEKMKIEQQLMQEQLLREKEMALEQQRRE